MVRTQIQLTEGQLWLLKRLATDRGVSVATLMRESVERFVRAAGPVDDQEQWRRALAAAGGFHSGRPDLAAEHDRYLLVQHRLGLEAVRTLQEDILPLVRVHWASEADHRAGVTALLTANRRLLSLVDCVSFLGMRQLNLKTAFAFDRDFNEQGFETLPAPPAA